MTDQLSGTFEDDELYSESESEEYDSEPENDISAPRDSLVLSKAPSLPVSEEYQQAIDASSIEVDIDYFYVSRESEWTLEHILCSDKHARIRR